jgi:hypothetical protein
MDYITNGRKAIMSNLNTLRAIPTARPAWMVFGPSATDRLVGALREAISRRDGYCTAYADACAWLARANRSRAEYRRANQRDAMRAINAARAAIRARAKAVVVARAALVAAGMTLDQIAVLAPGGEA